MKSPINILRTLAVVSAGAILTGCSDTWDDHYKSTPQGDGKSVYETISSDPDLATFKKMIDIAGYDQLLAGSQTFTVWAPVNEALADVDLTDEDAVRRTVLNHIARFNISTAESAATAGVRMYNGKRLNFSDGGFGGVVFATPDILCSNGVVHTLGGVIPYAYNVREYIDTHSSTSRLAKFLARFDEKTFDMEHSKPIDVNENGETVYDSVLINTNRLLDTPVLGLGSIANEDSVFTMIIPTDQAWDDALTRIKPWFVTASDSITEVQTSLAIFSNFIFRNDITSPAAFTKLISTSGREYKSPQDIFAGATHTKASNGSIWLTNSFGNADNISWNPDLEIEAEYTLTRRTDQASRTSARIITVNADNDFAMQISDMSYIYVTSSSLSNPKVEFTIENPLSGKYEIHAFFVPAIADNALATDETTRLKFTVTYPRNATTSRTQTQTFTSDSYVTSATEMTEIVVGEVTFPSSHFVDRLRMMQDNYDPTADPSPFKVTVETNVTQSEFNTGTLRRSFRLDRIVLVPVIQ